MSRLKPRFDIRGQVHGDMRCGCDIRECDRRARRTLDKDVPIFKYEVVSVCLQHVRRDLRHFLLHLLCSNNQSRTANRRGTTPECTDTLGLPSGVTVNDHYVVNADPVFIGDDLSKTGFLPLSVW